MIRFLNPFSKNIINFIKSSVPELFPVNRKPAVDFVALSRLQGDFVVPSYFCASAFWLYSSILAIYKITMKRIFNV